MYTCIIIIIVCGVIISGMNAYGNGRHAHTHARDLSDNSGTELEIC